MRLGWDEGGARETWHICGGTWSLNEFNICLCGVAMAYANEQWAILGGWNAPVWSTPSHLACGPIEIESFLVGNYAVLLLCHGEDTLSVIPKLRRHHWCMAMIPKALAFANLLKLFILAIPLIGSAIKWCIHCLVAGVTYIWSKVAVPNCLSCEILWGCACPSSRVSIDTHNKRFASDIGMESHSFYLCCFFVK